eukprot:c36895_g1_i1 orf=253-1425(+)
MLRNVRELATPEISDMRPSMHSHASQKNANVGVFPTYCKQVDYLGMSQDTGALDLLANAAMQFQTGKSFGIGETMVLAGRESSQSCLVKSTESLLLQQNGNLAKKSIVKQRRSVLSKTRGDGGNTATQAAEFSPSKLLKGGFTRVGFAKKMQDSNVVLVEDRCPSFKLKQRGGLHPSLDKVLRGGNNLIVQSVMSSPHGYSCQGRKRKASYEQDQTQERENDFKIEVRNDLKIKVLLAANVKEREQVELPKAYASLGQFIKPTACILQSVRNAVNPECPSEDCFVRNACSKGECSETPFECHEAQEANIKSRVPAITEMTTSNGHCDIKDATTPNATTSKERDPLIRSKRGRCQVLPIRFLDSVVPPLRGKPRRRRMSEVSAMETCQNLQ